MDTKSALMGVLDIIGFEADKEAFVTEFIETSIQQAADESAIEQTFARNFYDYIASISISLTEDTKVVLAQYLHSLSSSV
ncbi:MAG: hypothetical protein NUV52_03450 [Candidatus Roizmanbacteria bacterium]|nr:hypothetical protein [Candidatus Roizmanbacteria bacterium]